MNVKKSFECNLPSYVVSFLANGDIEGLNNDDLANINAWLATLEDDGYTNPAFDYDFDSLSFCDSPAFGLPCECYKTTVTQFE